MSTSSAHSNATAGRTTSTLQKVTTVVGAVFVLVGIAGFIPGVTTHYDQLSFAGHESMALLLGVFMVSILHNIVHLSSASSASPPPAAGPPPGPT